MMLRKFLMLTGLWSMGFGCVCEPNILLAFQQVEQEVLTNNILVVNTNLNTYNSEIKKNTTGLKRQTPEYKKLVEHEAALALKLEQTLFELRKLTDIQANKNKVLAEEIQVILKQNESLSITQKILFEKERI